MQLRERRRCLSEMGLVLSQGEQTRENVLSCHDEAGMQRGN